MSSKIAFPMYNLYRPDSEALIQAVQALLAARGVAVTPVWPEEDLLTHWQSDDLLLSQACGYPLVTRLPEVQTVGCFHYSAPGCEGIRYRSLLVVRQRDRDKTLADFRGSRAVCNAPDSQSGYNVFMQMAVPLAPHGTFFRNVIFSGSHRQSLVAIGEGRADIAAIDCVTFALLQRHAPMLVADLAVIGESPAAPGLPLITSRNTPPSRIALLRDALRQLVSDPAYRTLCAALFISGFSDVSRQDYASLLTGDYPQP
ncbi:PhnD/SsuA/transferrin family substrate-binding protein [Pseudescherichia sp.]|uniref:phosphate/phosphite/phosphonate ABC transporter substrate-binding protein n=1 Tax=Pseudescherichia sp. TaxID=2055881 RepID=UPI0028AC74A1|nr:PhnD/SsuA/transferrin family substrate-binding protein [Pseudescherichia sp.]